MPVRGYRGVRWRQEESVRAEARATRVRRRNLLLRQPFRPRMPARDFRPRVAFEPASARHRAPVVLQLQAVRRSMRTSVRPARLAQAISRMNPAANISAQNLRTQLSRLTLLQRHGIVGHLRAGVVPVIHSDWVRRDQARLISASASCQVAPSRSRVMASKFVPPPSPSRLG